MTTPETYTTEQIMLLTGHTKKQVYENDHRFGWSAGIPKPSYKTKLYSRAKVDSFLQAQAITAQAQRLHGYGKNGRLLWPVTTCPQCSKAAGYFRGMDRICIDGHTTPG